MPGARVGAAKTFILELLKPSHYDDDGYVIQWWRGSVPSNSLADVYGLALDARRRQVLGSDVRIEVGVCDETAAVLP
ncbi:MAG: radical SAM protein, partial [Gaiellaceae bacterium]